MKQRCKIPPEVLVSLLVGLSWHAGAQASSECDKAWANYKEFQQQNVMEESQYALTVHGAAVRVACGDNALPVPPGTDTPHRPIVRKLVKPIKPAEPMKPVKPN